MKKGQKSKSKSKSKQDKKKVIEEEDSKEDLTSENNPQSPNLYSLLGVEKTATIAEIKKAYRRLVFMYHPDKTFQELIKYYLIPIAEKFMMILVIMMMKMLKKLISLKLLIISEKFIIQKILNHSRRNM